MEDARRLFFDHLDHGLALILLLARCADVLSTRLATPKLVLEANPIVRRLGWPFAYATLGIAGVAYVPGWGAPAAVVVIVLSLFVAAGNVSRIWSARAQGEEGARAHARRLAAASSPVALYGSIVASSLLTASAGALLLLFYPEPDEWAHFFAQGILAYALAALFYGSLSARRLRADALRGPERSDAS